ncbi:mRNA decay activator protein ZFP36L1 [Takifugu rubripes]|uniref:mRNA decay activator protein ZFP36 n=1 Tax=Takifugu rubripes TaxID=31033 RepID=A0A3B5K6W9_TAKRU|nr:mRNA decay activator protein ZFP36L1-like [Takifugu rubripes]|eukprot:XP_003976592.1 PREDICTED: zinc finger protein 36, C3H1 type-like 1 [Takifugu rubripes]
MPSDFLTPFLELEEEFCKSFRSLEAPDGPCGPQQRQGLRVAGFQRRHSLCPVTLPNSKFNSSSSSELGGLSGWGPNGAPAQQWSREGQLPRSSLSHIPFRVDRSVSMIEGGVGHLEDTLLDCSPPGLFLSSASLSSGSSKPATPSPHVSTRYKTELCRTYEESGTCKYGTKCQFAHGLDELRGISRHPKYKTELCRTFHTIGFCPYGARCHFVHNADEASPSPGAASPQRPKLRPPLLRHSLSFAGFSSSPHSFQAVAEAAPSALLLARASSVSPSPPSTGSPELLSPLLPEPGPLKHCPYPFSGVPDLPGEDLALHFCAVTDSTRCVSKNIPYHFPQRPPGSFNAPPGLQRCSSADSLSEEGYTSSCSLSSSSSGRESPSSEGRRLPIFSRLSVTDE